MGEFVYKDYKPCNSRVLINYKAKPGNKVKFSYPIKRSYDKAVWKSAYETVKMWWLATNIIFILYPIAYITVPILVIYIILNPIKVIEKPAQTSVIHLYRYIIYVLIYIFYAWGIPALITYYLSRDKERLAKWVPKMGHWATFFFESERIFTKKDIDDKKVIIPNFSNVFLEYKCTKDFDKYLDKVEIMEIPFYCYSRSFLFPFIKRKKNYNEYDFRAVFYFSQAPKSGDMKVNFV